MKIQPAGLYRAAGQKCPNIDYYHADLIENKHNSAALEAAIDETFSCSPGWNMRDVAERLAESAAMRVLALGDQDIRVSFATVREFVRKMIALPGQRLLMSPGFLVLTPEARAEESQIIDMAAQANVLVAFSLRLALHAKKPSRWLLAVGLFALGAIGLAPLVSSTYLQARGVYRIRVVVLGLDELPVEDARVISSSGGEPKRVASGWEFDIPPPNPAIRRDGNLLCIRKQCVSDWQFYALVDQRLLPYSNDPTTVSYVSNDTRGCNGRTSTISSRSPRVDSWLPGDCGHRRDG